jgi:2-amino-4-hydroxy-6-hydroxymethyldihydropteridine diphosphokinase
LENNISATRAHLLLGGNEAATLVLFKRAAELLAAQGVVIVLKSGIYSSPSWGYVSEKQYFNQAIEVLTHLLPQQLLAKVLYVEQQLGRLRDAKTVGYSDRPIDIDILLYDELILNTEALVIPHPKLPERKFALYPLVEIAPETRHPVYKCTIQQLLNDCKDNSEVNKYG